MAEIGEVNHKEHVMVGNRHNLYIEVNCAVGDDADGEDDSGDYYYGVGEGRVILITNGVVGKVWFIWSEIELGDIEGRNADTDVEAYLVSRSVAGAYRDATRAPDFDFSKTLAKTHTMRREMAKEANDSSICNEFGKIQK